jgi:hypothetical protein
VGNVLATHCSGFLLHWNGRSWRTMKIGSRFADGLEPAPVAASSASNVWVFPVSTAPSGILFGREFALRWNGRRWHASRFPRTMAVTSAEAFSARDVWAFGITPRGPAAQVPYVARYNGRRWRTARLPGQVLSVGATGADNLWAVGPSNRTAAAPVRKQTLLAMRWTGRGWRSFALPRLAWPKGAAQVAGHLTAVSPTEFWWQYSIATDGGGPDAGGLLHCQSGRCQHVALPPNAVAVLAMAPDGRDGIVISALDESSQTYGSWQEWYDYSSGRWRGQVQLSPRHYNSMYFGLAWIPGTQSVWSVGEADANSQRRQPPTEGVIARYSSD